MPENSLRQDHALPPHGGIAKSKPWKGLLASFVFVGAGQFFSGARKRGIVWFAVASAAPFGFFLVYNLPFVPGKLGIVFLVLLLIFWVAMMIDSWRPIQPLRWWGWLLLIAVSLLASEAVSLASHRMFHAFQIPTASMSPTVSVGDRILVSRFAYWFTPPRRGDLIAFGTGEIPEIAKDPSGKEMMYIKRIVGLPGDRIEILDPGIKVNGVEMKFGDPAHPIEYYRERYDRYEVPDGKYFVLGDNSRNTFDSRYWGPISRHAIYGKVTKIYWPWSRMGTPR